MIDLENLPPDRRKQYDEWPRSRRRASAQCFIADDRINFSFIVVNKCGCTSATKAIRDHGGKVMGFEAWRDQFAHHTLVSMWRNPHERMESTYRWAHKARPYIVPEFFPTVEGRTFAQWVEVVCAEPADQWYDLHLATQVWLNTHPHGCWPGMLIPWNFQELWRLFKVRDVPEPMNTSDKSIETVWTPAARAAFDDVYSEDIHVWEQINGF